MSVAIAHIVGARPNYVKVAPVWHALNARLPHLVQVLIDTGQHSIDTMTGVFRRDLGLPAPDWSLHVGSGTRDEQIARVMSRLEGVCDRIRPDLVIAVGDVNSTVAAARTAAQMGIPLAHVEAGLRSFDPTMPEERNRIETDRLADVLFTPSIDANENLAREGVPAARVHLVGNVMIDSLAAHRREAVFDRVEALFPVRDGAYAVATFHRAGNVDEGGTLARIVEAIERIAEEMPVVFPVHPRTERRLREFGLAFRSTSVLVSQPLGYLDFLSLTSHARVVITDSGGLQEESAYLGVPCVTVRGSTERPVTLGNGANRLVATDAIVEGVRAALGSRAPSLRPDFWDGRAAHRIVDVLQRVMPRLSAWPDSCSSLSES
jgi:UDP-N-acetylglucosamine 2-epimerase (non-hydrolysing)